MDYQKVLGNIYEWHGSTAVLNKGLLLEGDYLWKEGLPDGRTKFTSSRGLELYYGANAVGAAEGFGDIKKAVMTPVSDMTEQECESVVDSLRTAMQVQSRYEDADTYRASPDGGSASAIYRQGDGGVTVMREGNVFWPVAGVTLGAVSMPETDYNGFNPNGTDFTPNVAQDPSLLAMTKPKGVLARIAETIKNKVMSMDQFQAPEIRPETAVTKMDAAYESEVSVYRGAVGPGVKPGAFVSLEPNIAGHGLGMQPRATRHAVVLDNGDGKMSLMRVYLPDEIVPESVHGITLPKEGPLKYDEDWIVDPSHVATIDKDGWRGCHGQEWFQGRGLSPETVQVLRDLGDGKPFEGFGHEDPEDQGGPGPEDQDGHDHDYDDDYDREERGGATAALFHELEREDRSGPGPDGYEFAD